MSAATLPGQDLPKPLTTFDVAIIKRSNPEPDTQGRLEAAKRPVDVMVVDHVERPGEN